MFGYNIGRSDDPPHPKPASVRASNLPADLLRSSSNLSHYTFAVFRLPDELFLSILSHISPDPHLTGPYARFCVQYCMKISDGHQERIKFLRPLSKTCRAMRLRLLPWIWDHIQPSQGYYDRDGVRWISWKFTAIARAVCADMSLATRIKYPHVLFCSWIRADSRSLQIPDGALPGESSHLRVCRVPKGPPKPPHTRDRVSRRRSRSNPTQEGAWADQTPSD